MENLITFGVVALALLVGLALFGAFAFAIAHQTERDNTVSTLSAKHYNAAQARTNEKIRVLNQLRMRPDDPALNAKYKELDTIDKQLTAREIAAIVSAETSLDERTLAELEAGINPYPKPQPAPSGKTAKARR